MNIKKNVLVFTLISIVSVGTITAVTKEEARIHFTNEGFMSVGSSFPSLLVAFAFVYAGCASCKAVCADGNWSLALVK